VVANRSLDRAEMVASRFGGRSVSLAAVPDELPAADIVIASTGSQLPILGKGAVEKAIRKRKHRPMFMVDLAVPRDIEPEVGRLDDVFLYTVDDLHGVIEENRRSREGAAEEAENLIREGPPTSCTSCGPWMPWRRSSSSVVRSRTYGTRNWIRRCARSRPGRSGNPAAQHGAQSHQQVPASADGAGPQGNGRGRIEVTDWLRELHGIEAAEQANAAGVGDQSSETPQQYPTSGTRSTS